MSRRSVINSLANAIISILAINQFPVNMELLIEELGSQLEYGTIQENYSCIIKKANNEWFNNQINFIIYIDKRIVMKITSTHLHMH
ncbi:hypothetical protein [Bacillus sp. NPDC094106]|uniref:hypothetical protein n=1 Tax=Bacillus sp. NPDC094106 TaxID=3363949 RepID=UPI0038203B3C